MDYSKLSDAELEALSKGDYSKLSDDTLKAISGQKTEAPKGPETWSSGGVGHGILKALDLTSGLTRKGIGEAVGVENLPSVSDIVKGAPVPMTKDMMKQQGVLNDYPKLQTATGFVGDVALDPANLLFGLGLAAKAGKLAKTASALGTAAKVAEYGNPLGKAIGYGAQKVGAPLYNSAFKKIDARAIERGEEGVSKYALENGMWGGNKSLQEQMDKRLAELGGNRNALYKEMEDAGIHIDPQMASQGAYDYIKDVAKNPYAKPKVDAMVDYVSLAKEPMTPSAASAVKTSLYDQLPASAFDQFGKLTNEGKGMLKSLSQGYKTELEKAAEFYKPGKGQELASMNKEMGAYLGAQKPTMKEITKEGKKDLLTQVKGALSLLNPQAAAGMYGAQALNSPAVRTGAGLFLDRFGNAIPTEQAWRQIIFGLENQGEDILGMKNK